MPPASKRAFVAGATGSGKSFFLRRVLLPLERRAIILDTTGDFIANRRDLEASGTVAVAETWDDVVATLPRLAAARDRWRLVTFLSQAECVELAGALLPERLFTGKSVARALGGCALVCDELSQFAPHNADEKILNLWRRGRHVGLTILGASQAPADVSPVVRGMSRYLVLFHLHEPNALGYFARMIPPAILAAHETLGPHECIVFDTEARAGWHLGADGKVRRTLTSS